MCRWPHLFSEKN
ncbi:hypothetical protein CP8484711_0637A, partial [Chlamydia psittaci 84-8471/1]